MKLLPDISFVILNYNGIEDTRELLISIKKNLQDILYEVIVVDNGSKADEYSELKNEFQEYIILKNQTNLGFAGGNNVGIKASTGRYIMLINNDTLLTDSSISQLVKNMDEHPEIGAISPKIHFFSPSGVIQYAGYTRLSRFTLRNKGIGFGETDRGQYDVYGRTESLHGAAMMIRRVIISKTGLMPEDYFLYYEELDWSEMIKKAGFEIWFDPSAVIVHKESRSTGRNSPLKKYYMVRNRLIFAKRNRRGLTRIFAILYQLTIADIRELIGSLLVGRVDLAIATIHGVMDFFFNNKNYSK
ncbi:MAG: glycosyltransferase family 2 protein [Bacteroidetes bacterium]|nr:glycosyltransferase family 2 protein [Bacteroidota bacterium]